MHKFWFVHPYLFSSLKQAPLYSNPECFPGSYLFKIVNSSNSGCIVCFITYEAQPSPDRLGRASRTGNKSGSEGLLCVAGCREDAQQHVVQCSRNALALRGEGGLLTSLEALWGLQRQRSRCIHPDLTAHSAGLIFSLLTPEPVHTYTG